MIGTYIVMAYIVMAYIVMATVDDWDDNVRAPHLISSVLCEGGLSVFTFACD